MFITVDDGVDLYVERRGKGVPCIYLHGGPGYWSKSFSEIAGPLLEDQFEMIYLDQRGCGRSSKQSSDYSLRRLMKDLDEIKKQLNIEDHYMMGHSFGGILAANYAAGHNPLLRGILLINVTLNMKESFIHQIKKGSALLGIDPIHINTEDTGDFMDAFYYVQARLYEAGCYFDFQYMDISHKKQLDDIDKDIDVSEQLQLSVFSDPDFFQDFTLITSRIDVPAFILTGTCDDAVGPDHYESFQFKNALIRKIETAHHPYLEAPHEFQTAISDFLKYESRLLKGTYK
ncbi:alpha/beta fold hydrolase [Bacillus sp. 1P06AnD]|uniref:alpha/beta fold hydrolase n=1 Tax=Bacillus sp. 1P06AnD TaxID=3132208 RepID=UPI0039A11C0E